MSPDAFDTLTACRHCAAGVGDPCEDNCPTRATHADDDRTDPDEETDDA